MFLWTVPPYRTCLLCLFHSDYFNVASLLQLYNKNRTADEFMGSSTLYLKDFELYK